jgi:flagellar assembly protein FliH
MPPTSPNQNMKWSETIAFSPALREVRLITQVPAREWGAHLREREEAAYLKGRSEGDRACGQQLLKQRKELESLQVGVLKTLQEILPRVLQEAEPSLIQLALASAQKIVAGLPVDIAMVEAVVREALQNVQDTAEVAVQLHPEDLALLHKHESPLLTGSGTGGPLRFSSSQDATRGGCLVQTRFGTIDARRETKLEQLQISLNL